MKKIKELDPDRASDYFEANMRTEIETLLASNDRVAHARGMTLLTQVDNAHLRNQFINESIVELAMFANSKETYDNLARQLPTAYNNPNRMAILQQMHNAQTAVDNYFQNRGLASARDTSWPMDSSFDYLGSITANLADTCKAASTVITRRFWVSVRIPTA